MKTTFKTMICALALSTSVAFAGPGSDAKKPTSFATGIYKSNSGDLNVNIEKKALASATVLILDSKGEVLSKESLGKKQTRANIRFDVSNLQDGEYQIKVISKGEKEITDFSITSTPSVTVRTLTFE